MRYRHDRNTLRNIRKARKYVANFDSAAAMLRSTGRFLRGKDFPGVGIIPSRTAMPVVEKVVGMVNNLPRPLREFQYSVQGAMEALSIKQLNKVRAEVISHWVVSQYPAQRTYPAIVVGSSNGALTHLCAALQIPWLPQTVFIPVKQKGIHVDEPKDGLEWGRAHATTFLENNPELRLYHMFDPNQDRLMMERMTYFRIKRLVLGEVYKEYIRRSLQPGGTIIISECQRKWPVTRINDRHVFQFGALGGATEKDFFEGSEAVSEYLHRYESHRSKWDAPKPTGNEPEAEWGFAPELADDIEAFAAEEGYKIKRLQYTEPEDLSPLVADLYRWWYHKRGYRPNRLLIESFLVHEPYWTLRTGSVPFWMKFNMMPSAEAVERYLDNTDPYDYIYLTLFSHGVEAVGLPTIDRWKSILARAQNQGQFLGVDTDEFPLDFAVYARYYLELKRIPARYPMPGPMPLSWFEDFLEQGKDTYDVAFVDS